MECCAYLDEEEVNPEGGEAPRQLDVLVLGVYLGDAHQRLVLREDFLLHVFHLHEGQRQELLQAKKEKQRLGKNQCLGSGSMWILIDMAPLDPDPGHSKWRRERGENRRFQVEKSIDLLMKAYLSLGVLIRSIHSNM